MATAKKLPSGSWRVRVYTHSDEDGKKHYKSFTAPTKREAELKALQYRPDIEETGNITVSEAIDRYTTAKASVLSPATVASYRRNRRNRYDSIAHIPIRQLTTEKVQRFVSELSGKYRPKTVSNTYGLLMAAIKMFLPDARFHVLLPRQIPERRKPPTNDNIKALIDNASPKMRMCIVLAAFGSLRRGEICGLKHSDIDGCTVYVHGDVVLDENHRNVYKSYPKTSDSFRKVRLPKEAAALIPDGAPDDFIIDWTPAVLTNRFMRFRDRYAPGVRFHDLRHYYASIGAALGVPDIYLANFGGWSLRSTTMKSVYQGIMDNASTDFSDRMNNYFSELYDTI